MAGRGSAPGERRGGRKPGVPNKLTASAKAALDEAFNKLGGVDALVKFGRANPGEFYKIWARRIPQEHSGLNGEPIQHVVRTWKFGTREVQF